MLKNYAQDLLLAGYIIVLEQIQELIGRQNIPAKNMTLLLLNANTKWHSGGPCRDVH